MSLILSPYVIPSGGAVGLAFSTAASGTIVLSRATSGVSGISAFDTLYSGAPLTDSGSGQFYLDIGDLLPGPLDISQLYVYRLTDVNGTLQSAPISPVNSVLLEPDSLTPIFMRIMQGGVDSTTLPAGINSAQVLQAMPLNGMPPLPIIVCLPELVQQEYVPIGQNVINPVTDPNASQNIWTISEYAKRVYRVSIMSTSAIEREYYRDSIVAWWKIMLATVLQPMGYDLHHRYQAASYQVSDAQGGQQPGFYGCDVALEFIGSRNIATVSAYGLINTIAVTGVISNLDGSGVTDLTLTIPPTGSI